MIYTGNSLADESGVDLNRNTADSHDFDPDEQVMSPDSMQDFQQQHKQAELIYSDYEVLNLLNAIEADASAYPSQEAGASSAQFNGMRVMLPNKGTVFVVEGGKKRGIPNARTYRNLFRSWKGIHVSMYVANIPDGRIIQNGAHLFTGNTHHVYILDHGRKRHIVGPPVFNKYHFDWKKIRKYPGAIVKGIPTGHPWR
jgi:hypothetical protein